ncbi:hypothetical protein GJ699_20500 [Duganella sp. FT80W]|uniref:Uncharacterized protein n=1 Tax=Duganella guangzhouensis TaxID=2666084 RepID=A0A6I2L2S2_9BURK|nr:hypothetical protein [Duganella guangzhouensis]MRW92381.1 hypothetical protein [Duganella guangzhouensis]
MVDKFMEFVQEQSSAAQDASNSELSVEAEVTRWLDHLNTLGKFVDDSLKPYAESGIKTTKRMVRITEEPTGEYEVPQFEISVGSALVRLKPIGTFLIGAFGRVDMEGPRGVCRFILVPSKAQTPLFAFNAPDAEQMAKDKPWADLVWKIMPAPPSRSYIDLSSEVFRDFFIKVVRGV